ncbi:MAG: hypothetical protein ABIK15_00430 [Pseudomonadota bacterium]
MKIISVFLFLLLLVLGAIGTATAELIDRGNGMIYDSDQDITWMQDANYFYTSAYPGGVVHTFGGEQQYHDADIWADQLVYGGYNDWRLPTVIGEISPHYEDNTEFKGYNLTNSEMGYMYYVNLGNLGEFDTYGNQRLPGAYGLLNTGPFINLIPETYWTGTFAGILEAYPPYFTFNMATGESSSMIERPYNVAYGWAVRDGDVTPTPISGAIWLLGSGLLGIVGIKRKFNT